MQFMLTIINKISPILVGLIYISQESHKIRTNKFRAKFVLIRHLNHHSAAVANGDGVVYVLAANSLSNI